SPRNRATVVGSNGYRVAPVRRQLTPGLISSLPGTDGLPPSICFSTSSADPCLRPEPDGKWTRSWHRLVDVGSPEPSPDPRTDRGKLCTGYPLGAGCRLRTRLIDPDLAGRRRCTRAGC